MQPDLTKGYGQGRRQPGTSRKAEGVLRAHARKMCGVGHHHPGKGHSPVASPSAANTAAHEAHRSCNGKDARKGLGRGCLWQAMAHQALNRACGRQGRPRKGIWLLGGVSHPKQPEGIQRAGNRPKSEGP